MIFKTLFALILAIGAAAPVASDSAQLKNEPIPHCLPCEAA